MEIQKIDDIFLQDGRGSKVRVSGMNDLGEILYTQGYNILDLTYSKKIYLDRKKLLKDFQPVDNSIKLSHKKNGFFDYFYKKWHNKEWDIYITISNSEMNSYDDVIDEDDLDSTSTKYRINDIYYKPDNTKAINTYLNSIIEFDTSSKNKINIIVETNQGYVFEEHNMKSHDLNIAELYNDDFEEINRHIIDKLNNAGKGVLLLYGKPGTGKTSYIKWLTTQVDSKFVFVPITMINHISSPSFIGDLLENKGSVLVIEDCENYIQDRSVSHNSIVSPLLQLTDGILSDLLDIKIICTFNTDLTKIDPALMREGRLIAEYEFDELSADKVEVLSGGKYNTEMTLAQIFNELTYVKNKKENKPSIGFSK